MIKGTQKDRIYAMNPAMQGARANAAASEAMVGAANNANGAMNGFMGVGMMNQGGAMFGANISSQSQSGMTMDSMNAPEMMTPVEPINQPVQQPVMEEPKLVKDDVEAEINEDTNSAEKPKAKFCSNCGAEVIGNFCTECGTKVA
jgi:hypothetical protein